MTPIVKRVALTSSSPARWSFFLKLLRWFVSIISGCNHHFLQLSPCLRVSLRRAVGPGRLNPAVTTAVPGWRPLTRGGRISTRNSAVSYRGFRENCFIVTPAWVSTDGRRNKETKSGKSAEAAENPACKILYDFRVLGFLLRVIATRLVRHSAPRWTDGGGTAALVFTWPRLYKLLDIYDRR